MLPTGLAHAVRRLRRTPLLSLGAILCIALGTAATAAALTLVSATLLRPLPFPDADRLVRVWFSERDVGARIDLSYPDVRDLRGSLRTIGRLEATARARMVFHSEEGGRRVEGEAVTDGYFDLLGVTPFVGRLFTPGEHRADAERVMLLDYRTWGSRFGYDEAVVGKVVATDRGPFTVVGVLPESFTGTVEDDSGDLEFWVPLRTYLGADRRERRGVGGIWTVGRLSEGASLEAAGAELDAVGRRLAARHPEVHRGHTLRAERMGENWRSRLRRGSLLLVASSVLLLVVAAVNVAILLLARAMGERREMAVRAALGAGRGRIVGSAAVEAMIVVVVGSALGLLAGPPLLRFFLDRAAIVDESILGIPVFVDLAMDWRAAVLSACVLLVSGLVAALAPALAGARVEPGCALRERGRGGVGGGRSRRWSGGLVLAQVTLTTMLVVGSALLGRSYAAMATADLGFRTDGVLRIALFVNERDVEEREGLVPFYQRVRKELGAAAGVEAVGMIWPTAPLLAPVRQAFRAPGLVPEPAEAGIRTGVFAADPALFEVLDLDVLAGRPVREGDGPDGPPVAVLGESLARRISGGRPLEELVGVEASVAGEPVRVVGVVGDVSFGGPREGEAHRYELYLSLAQSPRRLATLMVRTPRDPAELTRPLSRRLAAIAPASALDWVGPVDRIVGELFLSDSRFLVALVGLFTLGGLLLSTVGLFAVLADAVARRTPEIGIRIALGATPRRIVGAVVGRAAGLVGAGLALGALLAWWGSRFLDAMVYGIAPTDPWSYAAAATILLAVALLASVVPARRAASVPPAEALRAE